MRGLATPNYNGGPTDALLADFILQVEKKGFDPCDLERRIARRVHAMHQDVAVQFFSFSFRGDGPQRKIRADKAFEAAKALLSTHMPESGRSKESQDGAHDAMIEILACALGRAIHMLGQDKRKHALAELRDLHPDTCSDDDQKAL